MNILIIEDDQFFADHLRKAFRMNTIVNRVDIVSSFSGFMSIFTILDGYDIVLTDIRLTLGDSSDAFDGFHIIKTIREAKIKIPIIVISGRDDLSKIQGAFELGANDYMVKGIRIKELELRVMHWFKYYHLTRRTAEQESIYVYRKLLYNIDKNEFLIENSVIPLTKKSKYILSIFFTHAETLLSESFLIGKIWGDVCLGVQRNIRINILRLRQKLEPFQIHTWIRNIHGEGYIFSESE